MRLLLKIILFGSLCAQSIDNEVNEKFIKSLVDDLNRQRNNSVIKRIDESMINDEYLASSKIFESIGRVLLFSITP